MRLNFASPKVSTGDGFLGNFPLSQATSHPMWGIPVVRADVCFEKGKLGKDLGSLLDSPHTRDKTIQHLRISLQSRAARLGIDIANIHTDSIWYANDVLTIPVDLVFKPGEDRKGAPVANPLPEKIADWMKMQTGLVCLGRAYVLHPNCEHLGADAVSHEEEAGVLHLPGGRIIRPDGTIIVPASQTHFPLRFDLDEEGELFDVMVGPGGRPRLEELQPQYPSLPAQIPPHGLLVTSMQYSALSRLTVIVGSTVGQHSSSLLIDGNRTTGTYPRHLEVFNEGDHPLSTDGLGAEVRIYPTVGSTRVVSYVANHSTREVHREGLNLDQFLRIPEHEALARAILSEVERDSDAWGMLVGKDGAHVIPLETHANHQLRAAKRALRRYGSDGGDPDLRIPGMEVLSEYVGDLGDPRKRIVLFCKDIPESPHMKTLMDQGVQTVVSSNISRDETRFFMPNSLLSVYRRLTDQGLWLYWVTDQHVRRLWNHFFVDIHALERVREIDLVTSVYCSSVPGTDSALGDGFLRYLERLKAVYPHLAFINGASTGLMAYLNAEARKLGITTVGVGTQIPDQEPDLSLDACVFLRGRDFMRRQDLIARSADVDQVFPGGLGTRAELAMEGALRKVGVKLSPIICVDPIGLGNGGSHLWASERAQILDLMRPKKLPDGSEVVFAKGSEYLARASNFVSSFDEAYEVFRRYTEDPEGCWSEWGVPDRIIRTYLQRKVDDSKHIGFQIPHHYRPILERRGTSRSSALIL